MSSVDARKGWWHNIELSNNTRELYSDFVWRLLIVVVLPVGLERHAFVVEMLRGLFCFPSEFCYSAICVSLFFMP